MYDSSPNYLHSRYYGEIQAGQVRVLAPRTDEILLSLGLIIGIIILLAGVIIPG